MDIIEVAALGIYHTYYWISVLHPSHCVTPWSLIARNTLYIVWHHGFEHPVIPYYTLDKWNVYIIEIIFVWTCHSCWFGHSWDAICRDTLQVELHRPHNCLSVSQAPGFGPKGVEPKNCGSHPWLWSYRVKPPCFPFCFFRPPQELKWSLYPKMDN